MDLRRVLKHYNVDTSAEVSQDRTVLGGLLLIDTWLIDIKAKFRYPPSNSLDFQKFLKYLLTKTDTAHTRVLLYLLLVEPQLSGEYINKHNIPDGIVELVVGARYLDTCNVPISKALSHLGNPILKRFWGTQISIYGKMTPTLFCTLESFQCRDPTSFIKFVVGSLDYRAVCFLENEAIVRSIANTSLYSALRIARGSSKWLKTLDILVDYCIESNTVEQLEQLPLNHKEMDHIRIKLNRP